MELRCPHCAGPVTHAELRSARFLRARTCRSCGGEYFEGGARVAMAIVAGGGMLATGLPPGTGLPAWAPAAILFGFAALGVAFTHRRQPRPIEELRATFLSALLFLPVVAAAVRGLLALLA